MGLYDRLTRPARTVTPKPRSRGSRRLRAMRSRRVAPSTPTRSSRPASITRASRSSDPSSSSSSNEDLTDRVLRVVTEQLALDQTPLTRDERRQVVREITDDVLGYGPLEPLLREDSISEVMVNGPDRIYVEREGKIELSKATFVDDAHLLRIIDKIVSQIGRRVDESSPMVDARLPDGSRVNAIIPPLSLRGPVLTIRKFSRDPYTMDDLINFGSVSSRAAHFLAACVQGS